MRNQEKEEQHWHFLFVEEQLNLGFDLIISLETKTFAKLIEGCLFESRSPLSHSQFDEVSRAMSCVIFANKHHRKLNCILFVIFCKSYNKTLCYLSNIQ